MPLCDGARREIASAAGLKITRQNIALLQSFGELCGFIRSYPNFSMEDNLCLYQLVDPFSLFHLRFIKGRRPRSPRFWTSNLESPSLSAWKGYAFEQVCLSHSEQIKQALGIAAISTEMSSWRSRYSSPGAQIDLLLDRKDGIINLCEMKYYKAEYAISSREETNLRNKSLFLRRRHVRRRRCT